MNALVKQYLEGWEFLASRAGHQPPEGFLSGNALLLKYGKDFPSDLNSFEGGRMEMKQCYMNAAKLALADPSLTYVEGMAVILDMGFPFDHAWVVDEDGKVMDPTLNPKGNPEVYGGYFGIPFKTKYLRKVILKSGYWGLISHTNRDLFNQNKVKPEDFLETA